MVTHRDIAFSTRIRRSSRNLLLGRRAAGGLLLVLIACGSTDSADSAQGAAPGATDGATPTDPAPGQVTPAPEVPGSPAPPTPGAPSEPTPPGTPSAPTGGLDPANPAPADPNVPAPAEPAPVTPPADPAPPGMDPAPAEMPATPDPMVPVDGAPSPVDAVPSLIGDVALSVPSQTFQGQLEVGLSTMMAGAEIRYTADGTLPTATSPVYTAPLVLTETTQLRAQAFAGGVVSGFPTTGLYVARTFEASSNLPIIVMDSYASGKPTDKEVYAHVAVMIHEPVDGTASLTALPTLAVRGGYHIRGQSSAGFPQAPYKVEFWDNNDQDSDYPVAHMGAESDWALIPPYYDRALIRNPFIYDLGREIGLQAPQWMYAEVYLNYDGGPLTEEHYQGIYWFTETIKNQKFRTNLQQLKEDETMLPEISGGYIWKFDQAASEEPKLECTGADPLPGFSFGGGGGGGGGGEMMTGTCWNDLEVVDPALPNAQQAAWLAEYIQAFHDGLHATPMVDYTQLIDVPSFIDYLIVNELSLNVDAYVRSAYYHKDRDGKIIAGPLWDYNFALGGVGAQVAAPEDDTGVTFRFEGTRNVNNWYQILTTDETFMSQVRARYAELRQGELAQAAVEARLDGLTAPLSQAIVRDFAKWPVGDIITSETGFTGGPTVATWEGQVAVVHDFIVARLNWMDANL